MGTRGSISLQEHNPTISSEWDYSKNGYLTPSTVSYGSKKKVWWVCKDKQHSWDSVIKVRAMRGDGCPICSNKKILIGYNDLESARPDISAEWHPTKNQSLKPTDFVYGSGKLVWWQCSLCSHGWRRSISERTLSGSSCPSCSSRSGTSFMEQAIFYYIKESFPDAKNRFKINDVEADIYIPSCDTVIEYDGWRHLDKLDRDIEKNIILSNHLFIRIRVETLPDIEGSYNIIVKGIVDDILGIMSHISNILSENGIKHSNFDVDTQRDKSSILSNMYLPVISNSLGEIHPDVAKEWDFERNHPLTPHNISYGSSESVWWRCETHNHPWKTAVKHRTTNSSGCPYCKGFTVLEGYNDIKTTHPLIAEEWDYTLNGNMKPTQYSRGSNEQVFWRCKEQHSFSTAISQRTGKIAVDCPQCKKQLKVIGQLFLNNSLVGVRFMIGRRYGDISIDVLERENINVPYQKTPVMPLFDNGEKLLTEEEKRDNLHIDDYSENVSLLKSLKRKYG